MDTFGTLKSETLKNKNTELTTIFFSKYSICLDVLQLINNSSYILSGTETWNCDQFCCKCRSAFEGEREGRGERKKVTVQKIKFSINSSPLIHSFLWIWLHLLKKSLMENFIFCAVGTSTSMSNRRHKKRWTYRERVKFAKTNYWVFIWMEQAGKWVRYCFHKFIVDALKVEPSWVNDSLS